MVIDGYVCAKCGKPAQVDEYGTVTIDDAFRPLEGTFVKDGKLVPVWGDPEVQFRGGHGEFSGDGRLRCVNCEATATSLGELIVPGIEGGDKCGRCEHVMGVHSIKGPPPSIAGAAGPLDATPQFGDDPMHKRAAMPCDECDCHDYLTPVEPVRTEAA